MIAFEQLFFAAGSRSHEKPRHFGIVSRKNYRTHRPDTRNLTPIVSDLLFPLYPGQELLLPFPAKPKGNAGCTANKITATV
jgi:hypothetical protein